MSEDLDNWLEKVYQSGGDRETLTALYDDWAKDYDQQLWASGNPYIAISTGMVGKYIDYNARILDVGCGTGNMAQVLKQTGYQNIEGLDPSPGMLAIANHKGIYEKTHELFLSRSVDLPNESYDAVVAAGVFTHAHAPAESLDGVLKLLKSGGKLVFSLSKPAFNDYGFGDKIRELDEQSRWRQLDQSPEFRTYPFSEQEAQLRHWIYVYEKI